MPRVRKPNNSILKEVGQEFGQEVLANVLEVAAIGGKRKTRKQLKKSSKKEQNGRSLRKRTRRQIQQKR